MKNNQTLSGLKQTVAMMVDNVITSNMFNDIFWVEIFNEALSYIYGYHKWSWNIQDETITLTDTNTVQLSFPIQEILVVKQWDTELTQVQYFSDLTSTTLSEFIIDWDKLILNTNYTWEIRVIYRRWFIEYTILDINKQVDMPFFLNNILVSLMQFKILPIWLWEWSWWLMNNYLQDAIQQLERYKAIDTYAEAERTLYPNRR